MSVATVLSGIASGMVDDDGRTSKLFRIKTQLLRPSVHRGLDGGETEQSCSGAAS